MIRSSLVSGFLTLLTLSSVSVTVATADPIVVSADRRVYGYTYIDGIYSPQEQYSSATSGPFVAHIADAQIYPNASAAFEADQDTVLSPFLMGGTGSASATTEVSTFGGYPETYVYSYLFTNFTLDGNYNVDFSGFISASGIPGAGYLYAYTYLYSYNTNSYVSHNFTSDGLIPFSYSGTLGAGQYQMYLIALANPYGTTATANSEFDAVLSLTPAAVPDGGDTAILILIASALLGAFAVQQRRQA